VGSPSGLTHTFALAAAQHWSYAVCTHPAEEHVTGSEVTGGIGPVQKLPSDVEAVHVASMRSCTAHASTER
jgi:hypothetical protein